MSDKQTTSHILMIRPVAFDFNTETAVNNAFQQSGSNQNAQNKAAEEFQEFVNKLRSEGVDVLVVEDTPTPKTPDSIFPNNWVSFHADGSIFLYPMFAENRRAERKPHVLEQIEKEFEISNKIDLSSYEAKNIFLEGTGSMVLDRTNHIAYACLSPRTDMSVLEAWCEIAGFTPCSFLAIDKNGGEIYHTNVMMCVADRYVVICLESIADPNERNKVIRQIESSKKEIIPISLDQMHAFAGNMLQVESQKGTPLLVMSTQAFQALSDAQRDKLSSYNKIIHSELFTIEKNGGGSARCMMAEIFLNKKAGI
jgi:hypothetical protein